MSLHVLNTNNSNSRTETHANPKTDQHTVKQTNNKQRHNHIGPLGKPRIAHESTGELRTAKESTEEHRTAQDCTREHRRAKESLGNPDKSLEINRNH